MRALTHHTMMAGAGFAVTEGQYDVARWPHARRVCPSAPQTKIKL